MHNVSRYAIVSKEVAKKIYICSPLDDKANKQGFMKSIYEVLIMLKVIKYR